MSSVTNAIDAKRYPRLASYVGCLPLGLASNPDCAVKGVAVRMRLQGYNRVSGYALTPKPGVLPDCLNLLIASPPLPTAWVSEVYIAALDWVIIDEGHATEAQHVARMKELDREMYNSSVYRLLMMVASPSMLMVGAKQRWNQFHRGSSLAISKDDNHIIRGYLTFPPYVFDEFVLKILGVAFEAAIEMARCNHAKVTVIEASPVRSVFECTWG